MLGALAKQTAAFLMASSILISQLGVETLAQVLDVTTRPVRGQVAISRDLAISTSQDKVSLNLRDASVSDVLQMLAKQGKFNLILDSSVDGKLTVDIKNVSINKALEYIFTLMDLSYVKDGDTIIVSTKSTIDSKRMAIRTLKTIPVQYKSAVYIAFALNNTIFKVPRPGGSNQALAAADPDSNSLLIMGTDTDIKMVGDALRELDVPRNRKVYHIKHNLPADVANVLAVNFFKNNISMPFYNSGTGSNGSSGMSGGMGGMSGGMGGMSGGMGGMMGGMSGGMGGMSGGMGGMSGGMGGMSGSSSGSGSSTGSSTGSSGGSAIGSVSNNPMLGVTATTFVSDGVTFISEPVSSTLTVLGTEEQIALIDSVIDQIDVKRSQVAIEVALVEVQNSDKKTFTPNLPTFQTNSNLMQLTPLTAGLNTFTIKSPFAPGGLSFPNRITTSSNQFIFQQSNINTRNKVLANPTMVTIDGQSVSINITDTVASVTYSNTITNGIAQITPTITQQQAGVMVTLTPKVYNDGSVVLNTLTPTVTQPSGVLTIPASGNVPASSVPLLSTRTMTISGVRVRDGETLVVGGLLKESNQLNINKVPGLDKLPIVGAMFRAINQNDKDKTELVLMVTPHILKEDNVAYFKNVSSGKFSNMNYGRGGIVPVGLPKFTGEMPKTQQSQPEEQLKQKIQPESPAPLVPTSGLVPDANKKIAVQPASSSLDSLMAQFGMAQNTQSSSTVKSTRKQKTTVAEEQASRPNNAGGHLNGASQQDVADQSSVGKTRMNETDPVTKKSAPRIEIGSTGKSVGTNGGVAALMLAKTATMPTKPQAKAVNVYRSPSIASPPSLNPLKTLDEILK